MQCGVCSKGMAITQRLEGRFAPKEKVGDSPEGMRHLSCFAMALAGSTPARPKMSFFFPSFLSERRVNGRGGSLCCCVTYSGRFSTRGGIGPCIIVHERAYSKTHLAKIKKNNTGAAEVGRKENAPTVWREAGREAGQRSG